MAAGEDPQAAGEITYQPNVIPDVDIYYEDHNFVLEYKSFYIKIKPFVIYQGQYYGLKQIVQWIKAHYPAVSYKYLVEKGLDLIHYGYNLTQIPQEVADKIDYLGFRLTDLNFPLSWIKLDVLPHRKEINGEWINVSRITIPRANMEFSFQDLYPWGYTVEHINSTYVLIGAVKGKTDLYVDPITYSSPTITVIGFTEEDPCTFWDVWNASNVNGWGVVSRQGESQYHIECELTLGNGTVEGTTWFADTGQMVRFNVTEAMTGYVIYLEDYSHFRIGELIDPEKKITSDGCYLYFNLLEYTGFYGGFDNSLTEAKFYNSRLEVPDESVEAHHNLEIYIQGNVTYYGCEFINIYVLSATEYSPAPTEFWDCHIIKNDGLYLEQSVIFDKVMCLNTTYYLWISNPPEDVTIRNLYGRNTQHVAIYESGNKDTYVIDADLDVWSFEYGYGEGEVYRQYTFDLTVTYPNGTAINGTSTGARVVLQHYGQGGAVDYNATLGEDGSITTQNLTMGFYNKTGGDTIYSLNPYNLQILNVTGYQNYNANFTLSEKAQEISLLEETYTCTWIATNSTVAGEPTLFRSSWEELYDGPGLSHWRCSTNNTGAWVDSGWSSSWADTYWAEYELRLNSTEDLTIAFYFSAKDTAGNEWSSPNCTFTTPVTRVYEGPFFGVTHRVDYGLTLLVVSAPERNPSFQEFLYDKVEIPVELIILNREDRARYFHLSYSVFSESGELLKEGDLSLEIEPKAQQPVSFSFQVPYGKREAPKNFSVSILANGGEDPVELDLTLSHSGLSFIYPLAFIGAIGLIIGVAYIIVKKTKREKPNGP